MTRGLEERHEQKPQQLIRDTRPVGQRFVDFFKNPAYVMIILLTLAAAGFFVPSLVDLFLIIGVASFVFSYTRKGSLPFRLPLRSGVKDYNDLIPGTQKPRKGRGICFFGNDLMTNEELWFNNDDMRTHVLIFGSTGSGKTEALVSIAFNALVQGSGFIYVDGKGDNSLFAKIFSMCRRMGREDDILLINFMTGAKDIVGPQSHRLSNTMNPFASGSSSMLSQLVVSMMDSSSASPDGDMWKGRAISFVEALMRVLVYSRDQGYLLLDANAVRNYFHLDRVEALGVDKKLIRDGQEPISLADAPDVVLEPIKNYIINLPGYETSKKGKQSSQVLEQHGFITMQLTRVFTSLADTYGHILRTNLAEVDMKDVVLNRRILVVLLPALEKSPDELSNLGKVIIATLKAMMAAGLGSSVEGTYHEVIERKPTNAPTPYLCILDEYGYYAVPGFAVVPAQARSLGFSTIFAGQDLPAFQKASKEEAASIGANTNIKIAMKLEDPIETWEFFSKTAGEAFVTKVDSFQTRPESLAINYLDTRTASAEKRARIDLLDLKDQREGEAHVFFKSRIVRAKMFYANPPPVKRMRLNHFLKVEKPSTAVLREIYEQFEHFEQAVVNGVHIPPPPPSEDIAHLVDTLDANAALDPIEKGVSALLAFHEYSEPEFEEEIETADDELNIFFRSPVQQYREKLGITADASFDGVLLYKAPIRKQIDLIERLSGKTERHAANIAEEIVRDMEHATNYPPEVIGQPQGSDFAEIIEDLIEKVVEKKQQNPPE